MKKLTEKEFKALDFLIKKGKNYNTLVHGSFLTKVIFTEEVIKKYSFARNSKKVIDTMTFSYLGRMCRKELMWSEYKENKYVGHYCTAKGKKFYEDYLNK